jgi:hypothetical protein
VRGALLFSAARRPNLQSAGCYRLRGVISCHIATAPYPSQAIGVDKQNRNQPDHRSLEEHDRDHRRQAGSVGPTASRTTPCILNTSLRLVPTGGHVRRASCICRGGDSIIPSAWPSLRGLGPVNVARSISATLGVLLLQCLRFPIQAVNGGATNCMKPGIHTPQTPVARSTHSSRRDQTSSSWRP